MQMLQSEGMYPPEPADRPVDLVDAVVQAVGALGGQSVLFSQAIAHHLGMHPSDLDCLGLLAEHGSVPAGRLAELTGLTTGAVTRMIDRLARAGYVRRRADVSDRRRVFVELVAQRMDAMAPYQAALHEAFESVIDTYSFGTQQHILEFLHQSEVVMRAQLSRVHEQAHS
jgi:DNA-binding MarR family transcriptional regulator